MEKYINRSEEEKLSIRLMLSPQAWGGAAAARNRRKMALSTSNQKCDSTLQQSVLCQLSLLFTLGSLKMPINGSKLVLNISLFFLTFDIKLVYQV